LEKDLTYQAVKFKVRGRISLADCFAAALAHLEGAELVTGDLEFKQVEDEVKIEWI
jgi:predicted nucleic acid-binding protein